MSLYSCGFPGCGYSSNKRSDFDNHHIKSKEEHGTDEPRNRILLCPNCHRKILILNAKRGLHTKGTVILFGYLNTSKGRALYYKENGIEYLWFYRCQMREEFSLSDKEKKYQGF